MLLKWCCLFSLFAEYIMWSGGLDESKLESRFPGEMSATTDMQMIPLIREIKQHLDEGERGEWNSWLKPQHSKTKIMASSPITSRQIDGETMKTVTDFIFLGSKITVECDCSQEIKRCLLLGRKAMANTDSAIKSRDITLPTKVLLVKAMVFPIVTYRWRVGA